MSFDIYLQSFRRGKFSGISRQSVRDAFGPYLTEAQRNHWRVRYDEANTCDIDLSPDDSDPNLVQGFTVHRPCADQRLWNALAAVLTSGNIVLYFPGGQAPIVARHDVIEHLPSDMIDALGQPVVVTTASGILHVIQEA